MHVMKIGSRIRAERENQGISRTELAKFAGIATSTLSDLELGHSRSTTALHKIAERLGVSAQWLETGRGEKSTDTFPTPIGNKSLGYVRVQQMGEAGMGDGRENEDFPEIVRTVEYSEAFLRSLLGFLPPPGRLVLVTGKGDSMAPTIAPGEVVLVDTGTHTFEGDGLYLVNVGHGHQIKRLQDRGRLFVVSDNHLMPSFEFPEEGIIGGKVYLINKIERVN
ncbi:phage repressor protein C [Xylella fastidiosa subsp. fastidiosa]|nr:phage repressor protein C [Xylella fastidiosa subsp. fastidiosa]